MKIKKEWFKKLLLGLFVLVAGGCYEGRTEPLEQISQAEVLSLEVPETQMETAASCYVHVCGEVNRPGVYEMEQGERVYQAVERAGGFTESAASDYLNLAEMIYDGMKLNVPNVESMAGQEILLNGERDGVGDADAKVNLNSASKEQLMTLKGIGETKAEDIIRYREETGRFEQIEDIMKVPGIKNAGFEKIKDSITV